MRNGSHFRIQTFSYNCITVVLAGDISPVTVQVDNRLVGTAVTILQLFCPTSLRQCQQLVSQTDAEDRNAQLCDLAHIVDDRLIFGRIPRSIGKHDAVYVHRL